MKRAQMESKNTKLGYVVTLVKCFVGGYLTYRGYNLITKTEEFGAVTSKILGFIPKYRND